MSSSVPILGQRWYCPDCEEAAVTYDSKLPYHRCSKQKGLMTPLLREGTKGKHERVVRQDYEGSELVQRDSAGIPVMSIVTTRDDGQDCTVFAPTATVDGG
jgi:hypothetical protein